MVKVILGKKGTGKTKHIIEMVNEAAKNEKNVVVCIEGGRKLTYDISYSVRLIDVGDYPIAKGYDVLFGFLCGIYAHNFDITHVFIDSLAKVAGTENLEEAVGFLEKCEAFCAENTMEIVIMISADPACVPEGLKKYLVQA